MANAAAAPAAATSEESLWVGGATPELVAAAEADEALSEAVVEAWVPVTVVESEVLVAPAVSVPDLVSELELDLLLEQTTSVGRSVTPPRAQIDLATLMVAVMKNNVSAHCVCSGIRCAYVVMWNNPALMYSIGDRGKEREHTILVCLRAFISNAAGDIVQEGLGLADALEVNAAALGN